MIISFFLRSHGEGTRKRHPEQERGGGREEEEGQTRKLVKTRDQQEDFEELTQLVFYP